MSTGWIGQKGPLGRNVRWTHPQTSLVVRHCGHPTALRPYWIDGHFHEFGCFRLLKDAQQVALSQAHS